MVPMVQLDLKDYKESKVYLELTVLMAQLDRKDFKENKVYRELMVPMVL